MKKFLVTLLVAMLALSCVAYADVVEQLADHDTAACNIILYPDCDTTGICRHFNADHTYVDFILAPLGHASSTPVGDGEVVKEADCANKGVEKVVCDRVDMNTGKKCGETFERKTPVSGHVSTFYWIVKPNCSTYGIGATGCPGCGLVEEGSLITWWKGATAGQTKTIDGKVYKADAAAKTYDVNDPKNHTDLSGWLVITEDDCYNPLLKENYCRDCQTTIRYWEDKVHHVLGSVKKVQMNATNCKTPAVYANVQYCSLCSYFEVADPSPLVTSGIGHYNFEHVTDAMDPDGAARDAILNVASKYFDLDTLAYKKANADDTGAYYVHSPFWFYVDYVGFRQFAQGHHVINLDSKTLKGDDYSKEIDCSWEGNEKHKAGETWTNVIGKTVTTMVNTYDYKCAVCKEVIPAFQKTEVLTAPAHEYTAWKEVVAPTEDTNFIGKWTRYCLECSKYEEFIGGVCGTDNHLEDAPVLENVVEATYTADGSAEEVIYCAVCKEELSRKDVVLPMLEGINPDDNTLYEDGKASTATGIVTFGGKDYYLINGKKTESMGATLVDGTWYFMAHGIVQKVTQLAEYQGEWFVVENGKIDISYNGLVPYDGAKFLVGAGRIQTEQTTLYNDGTTWYLISAGKVATEYTGAFTYDGQVFDVVAGIVK